MACKKTKPTKAKSIKRKKRKGKASEDTRQRRKYKRGGRIEAYTPGEALKSKRWP